MRVKPDNHVGRTLETIQEARDDICSEWFYWSYRAVYDEDPAGVIRLWSRGAEDVPIRIEKPQECTDVASAGEE
jgi:hypothetical protein